MNTQRVGAVTRHVGLLALVALVGCRGSDGELAGRVTELESKLNATQGQLDAAKKMIDSLRLQVLLVRLDRPETAWFDPQDEQAYQAAQSPVGRVLVVLERVDPYLDGFKVTFRIGNPYAANFNGLEAKVEWGPKGSADANAPAPETKEVVVKLTDRIRSGAWTPITVKIAPAKPEDIRRIGLTPTFNNLSMSGSF